MQATINIPATRYSKWLRLTLYAGRTCGVLMHSLDQQPKEGERVRCHAFTWSPLQFKPWPDVVHKIPGARFRKHTVMFVSDVEWRPVAA